MFFFWMKNLVPTNSEITAVIILLPRAALKTPGAKGILVFLDISSKNEFIPLF